MVCGNFILPEPASYVFFYAIFNLRKLLYLIERAETRLAQEQHKLERLENRKKYLEQCVQAAISAEAKKITQPSGAATPRNSDAHERIAVPKAFYVLREPPAKIQKRQSLPF